MRSHSKKGISEKNLLLRYTLIPLPHAAGKRKRKKVNFMINEDLLTALKQLFPERERSDFVNEVLEQAFTNMVRKKAMDAMDIFRKTASWKMTDEQIRKAREYGRH